MTPIAFQGMASTRSVSVEHGTPAGRAWTIDRLWEADRAPSEPVVRGGRLPAGLAERFGARFEIPLRSDRPTLVANFVTTLDGVVALDRAGATGGREISGGFEPDRFVMGLLRATADAVIVGAGTVRASRTHAWTPASVYPPSAGAFELWRRGLRLEPSPSTVVVSASGRLDTGRLVNRPGQPVIVVTTSTGARRLGAVPRAGQIEIVRIGDAGRVPVDALLAFLHERGFRLVLSEAGPTLFGELLAAGAVDELFLTIAPQLVGRSEDAPRLGLIEGVGFGRDIAPWLRLQSVSRSDRYLFLRYALTGPARKGVS